MDSLTKSYGVLQEKRVSREKTHTRINTRWAQKQALVPPATAVRLWPHVLRKYSMKQNSYKLTEQCGMARNSVNLAYTPYPISLLGSGHSVQS